MNKKPTKDTPFFTRLSIPTIAGIELLMEDFGWKSRDVFAAQALEVLDAVKAGRPIPEYVAEARRRQAEKLAREAGGMS